VNTAFGIGTKLTNDLGFDPLNMVIKMTRCNGQAVAKISDEPTKEICDDPEFLAYVKHVFKINS
jgi:nicotinate phosphoribosyltransferase